MNDVFITDISAFLPNKPVSSDEMDKVLGTVGKMPARIKRIILASNGIRTRHYAIDPETGSATHTNAQITAEAIRLLSPYEGFSLNDIECLSCGTGTPDQMMPGHGPMVHGEMKSSPCEVVTTSGICLSGMTALKYAYMNVALGIAKNAVATGSDIASSYLKARFFEGVRERKKRYSGNGEILPFDTAFLRWMLSDGAGAVFMTSTPTPDRPALRIDWIEHVSYAGEMETCMYAGGKKNAKGGFAGWRHDGSVLDALEEGVFLIKQDVKLLNREVLAIAVERTLPRVVEKHGLSPDRVDWFLPHYSSEYYRTKFYDRLKSANFEIPLEKWFSNLPSKGNTGAASIYIIMEELFHSGKVGKGERLLCFVPESGRFSMCYMLLTAV